MKLLRRRGSKPGHVETAIQGTGYDYLKTTGGAVNQAILDDIADSVIDVGDLIWTASYFDGSALGGASYRVVAAGTGTEDGGSYIDAGALQLNAVLSWQIPLAQFGAGSLRTPNENSTAIANAVSYVKNATSNGTAGASLVAEELYEIDETIDLTGCSIRFTTTAGGFAGVQPSDSQGDGELAQGGFRWLGSAGLPMVKIAASLGVTWEVPMQGSATNEPSAYIEIADPSTGALDNQNTRIQHCRFGSNGTSLYPAERGLLISGSTGNDRFFLNGVEIFGCSQVGIDVQNHNAIWGSIVDVFVGGNNSQTPVALRTVADVDLINFNVNRCDLAIDVPSSKPQVTIHGARTEHTPQFAALSSGSKFAVYGGRLLLRSSGTLPPGAVWAPDGGDIVTLDVNDGGALTLENLLFLGLEYYDEADRPKISVTGTRPGGSIRVSGCGQLRHSDIDTSGLTTGGSVQVSGSFAGDATDAGAIQEYDGQLVSGTVYAGTDALPATLGEKLLATARHHFHAGDWDGSDLWRCRITGALADVNDVAKSAGAMVFDGSASYVVLPSEADPDADTTDQVTMVALVEMANFSANQTILATRSAGTVSGVGFSVATTTTPQARVLAGDGVNVLPQTTTSFVSTARQLFGTVITEDAIYVHTGEKAADGFDRGLYYVGTARQGEDQTSPSRVHVGREAFGGSYAAMTLHDIVLFDRALSQDELLRLEGELDDLEDLHLWRATGTTAERPTGVPPGFRYFDSTLDVPIWRNAADTAWIKADGTDPDA